MRPFAAIVSSLLLATTLVALPSGPTYALPLPLPTPGAPPTAGETDLVPLASGNVNVDWMVLPQGPGFRYFFQVENLSGALITVFTVVASTLTPATPSGSLAGDNLDVATAQHALGHNAGAFGGLAGEEEPTAGGVSAVSATAISGASAVTWAFGAFLPPGSQSDTLYFDALTPPAYGGASLTGVIFTPPFAVVWGTAAGDEVPVPSASVPVPEPTTLLLVGVGLVGAGVWGRRRLLGSRRGSYR